jgi:hypothetical protein
LVLLVAIKITVVESIDQQQRGLMFVRHEPFRKGRALVRKVPNMPPKKATVPEGDRERLSDFGYLPDSPS